jgi:uncharacterized protein
MKNAGSLADRSKKELADMARRRGVRGWEGMDKGALVKALSRVASKKVSAKSSVAKPTVAKPAAKVTKTKAAATRITRPAKAAKPTPKARPTAKPTAIAAVGKPTTNGSHKAASPTPARPLVKPLVAPKTSSARPSTQPREASKDSPRSSAPAAKDRILLAVPDPHWLHAMWNISAQSVQRAEAALKQDWHGARLIIRLFDVTSHDTTSTSETPVRDVVVEGSGNTWYIGVPQPPRMYRADIGYLSRRGEFWPIARSNVVTPPKAGSGDLLDANWDDPDSKWKAERMLAMSTGFESSGSAELREFLEERTGKTLGPPKETAFGTGATPPGSVKKFFFEIDAKLIVFGRTDPTAHLTLNNDPIRLNPDGTFRMTFSLPDSRQIIPAVAASADGVEERTIVLAIERNTKHLDPMIHDQLNEV